jgi:RNA polymerase sigma-70 factor, ECF subfamily
MGHVGQSSRLRHLVFGASEADWDALFAEQLPRIHDFFRYRVGPGAIAEDLTSLTFEKAWAARHQYRRDLAAFGTWLYAIARNVAHDHYRRGRRHEPLEAAAEVAAHGPTPEDLAVERSEHERLARLLETLPDREREVIALKYGAGLTNRAVAKMTGLTESNVGTIVFRTVRELRARWEAPEAAPAPARDAEDDEHAPRSRAVAGVTPIARWKEQR